MTASHYPAEWVVAPIGSAHGTVRLPGSKSLSNRALLLAALAEGTSRLRNLLAAEDTHVMIEALRTLGVAVDEAGDAVVVHGCGGRFPVRDAELFLGNAGTAMRPLTAALAFSGGRYRLDGVARMRERPIGDLVDALNAAGARIAYLGTPGYPPLQIEPATQPSGEHLEVRGAVSSQFVSGLLMAAPLIAPGRALEIEVPGNLISEPYVTMTLGVMRQFGVTVERHGNRYRVPRAAYAACADYAVEGDASAASYFLALGALAGGPIRIEGAGAASVQGDVAFADVVMAMGGQRRARAGLDGGAPRRLATAGARPRLHRHSRRRDDGCGARAVRRRSDAPHRHRLMAREGNRSHRGDGDRVAQARRNGGRGRGLAAGHAADETCGPRRSIPTTTTAWRCAWRSRRAAAYRSPSAIRSAWPRPFPTTSTSWPRSRTRRRRQLRRESRP